MQGNTRTLGIAGYDADGHSFGGEAAHETLAEKPGAAEYTHRHHRTGPVVDPSRNERYAKARFRWACPLGG